MPLYVAAHDQYCTANQISKLSTKSNQSAMSTSKSHIEIKLSQSIVCQGYSCHIHVDNNPRISNSRLS